MKRVFLGGTCANSTWREDLIQLLTIDFFDPVVDDWNEAAQKVELREREECDFCLYVITLHLRGDHIQAEIIDDSNKRPKKTVFCYLEHSAQSAHSKEQLKSLQEVGKMVERNGGKFLGNLQEVADYLNKA